MIVICLSLSSGTAWGYDVTGKLSVGGVLAGAWQYLQADEDANGDNVDDGNDDDEALSSLTLSCDQQLGDIFGAFLRLGIQDDAAAITWEKLYSGGLNISGGIWGREQDTIGLGVAYLDDGNTDLKSSLVCEGYVRFVLNEMFAATADFQYLADDVSGNQNPDGWVGSIRLTAEF